MLVITKKDKVSYCDFGVAWSAKAASKREIVSFRSDDDDDE